MGTLCAHLAGKKENGTLATSCAPFQSCQERNKLENSAEVGKLTVANDECVSMFILATIHFYTTVQYSTVFFLDMSINWNGAYKLANILYTGTIYIAISHLINLQCQSVHIRLNRSDRVIKSKEKCCYVLS